MSNTIDTFENILDTQGVLIYENKGKSMMPLIKEGRDKMVIVKKSQGRLRQYDVPLYKRKNGKYVLHRIMEVRKNDYVICGDNCWRCEYGITDEQIIGVLSSVIRKGKTISITDKYYQHYVSIWCKPFLLRRCVFWLRDLLERIYNKVKSILKQQ